MMFEPKLARRLLGEEYEHYKPIEKYYKAWCKACGYTIFFTSQQIDLFELFAYRHYRRSHFKQFNDVVFVRVDYQYDENFEPIEADFSAFRKLTKDFISVDFHKKHKHLIFYIEEVSEFDYYLVKNDPSYPALVL